MIAPPAELVQVAAMMLAVAITSTGRPFLTLLVLIGVPTILVDTHWWSPDDWVLPIAQLWVVVALGVLAVVEHLARSRALYAEAIEALPWDRLMVNIIVWLLYVWGVTRTLEGATPPPSPTDLAREVGPQAAALLAGSLSVHTAAAWARQRALGLFRSVGLGGIAHWVESFGVLGVMLVAVSLPVAALALAGFGLLPVLGVVVAARLIEGQIDRNRRRPCPHCNFQVRGEASLCPECWTELPITRPLAPVKGALAAVRAS